MMFEWDTSKSDANLQKHGIDFVDAQKLWDDAQLIVIDAKYVDEPRRQCIGKIDGKVWTAITTARGASTRIISVRRAREQEIGCYENN